MEKSKMGKVIQMTADSVSIELQYDSEFQESVTKRERPDPIVRTRVKVGDTYVFGDENYMNSGYMTTNLIVQLGELRKILADEKVVIEYENGPMWLVFEPHDEDSVKLTGCATIEGVRNPDQRLSVDTSAVVAKKEWVSELIETAENFYETVIDLNPSLEDNQMIQRLQKEITDAKRRREELELE